MLTCEHSLLSKYVDALRFVWAETVLYDAPFQNPLETPLRRAHPLAEVLTALLSQKMGCPHPPLKEATGTLTMGELCQLAILREVFGECGQTLGQKILSLCSFPSLWCSESGYNSREAQSSIALLLRAFGKETKDPIDESPYFRALAKVLPRMKEGEEVSDCEMAQTLDLGGEIQNAFVTLGEKVPLGAMKIGCIEVPSFGPQVHPLNDPHLFGIHRTIAHPRWVAVSARSEIWFEYFLHPDPGGLEMRFMGLTPEHPISFVFYVKADLARIDNEVYLPKNLRRYCKESKKVIFEKSGSQFSIENRCPCKMELIPLAGDGCFWDSDFLLGFEIPVHDGRAVFQFH